VVFKFEMRKEIYFLEISHEYPARFVLAILTKIQMSSSFFKAEVKQPTSKILKELDDLNLSKTQESDVDPESLEIDNENKLCIICMDCDANVVLKPCGHGGLCKECLVSIFFNGNEECPLCREVDIVLTKKFYRAFVVEKDPENEGRFLITQCLDVNKIRQSGSLS